jgi:hypothetical protein
VPGRQFIDFIERPASRPDADLACEFDIAKPLADSGFRAQLGAAVIPPVREIDDGVAVTFRADAWDDVRRYIEVESQCCPFLNLSASRRDDTVELRVTGRPEAREFIRNIFTTSDCC